MIGSDSDARSQPKTPRGHPEASGLQSLTTGEEEDVRTVGTLDRQPAQQAIDGTASAAAAGLSFEGSSVKDRNVFPPRST